MLRARLRDVTPAQRERAAARINRSLWALPPLAHARCLLLFAALPDELPTDGIAEEARRRAIQVVYPRCLPEHSRLSLHRTTAAELRPGKFGIREPDPACERVAVEEVDAALVPGLAWDRAGRRLGRGAGYYDRLFADPAWRGFRCGLFLACQEVAAIPTDPWDAPLHAVATEKETLRFSFEF